MDNIKFQDIRRRDYLEKRKKSMPPDFYVLAFDILDSKRQKHHLKNRYVRANVPIYLAMDIIDESINKAGYHAQILPNSVKIEKYSHSIAEKKVPIFLTKKEYNEWKYTKAI